MVQKGHTRQPNSHRIDRAALTAEAPIHAPWKVSTRAATTASRSRPDDRLHPGPRRSIWRQPIGTALVVTGVTHSLWLRAQSRQ